MEAFLLLLKYIMLLLCQIFIHVRRQNGFWFRTIYFPFKLHIIYLYVKSVMLQFYKDYIYKYFLSFPPNTDYRCLTLKEDMSFRLTLYFIVSNAYLK